jgi:hypothetical protein
MIISTLATLAGEPPWHVTYRAVRSLAGLSLAGLAPSPAPGQAPASTINTDGIVTFIATKVSPILLAVLGVIFISRAGKGEMSKVLTSSAIAIIGLAFIAGAGALFLFGESMINLIFK